MPEIRLGTKSTKKRVIGESYEAVTFANDGDASVSVSPFLWRGEVFQSRIGECGVSQPLTVRLSSPTVCICFVARWQVDAVRAKA